MAIEQVNRYLSFQWDNPGRVGKGKSENIVKERCKSTDWFVTAAFFAKMLRLNLSVKKEAMKLEVGH